MEKTKAWREADEKTMRQIDWRAVEGLPSTAFGTKDATQGMHVEIRYDTGERKRAI